MSEPNRKRLAYLPDISEADVVALGLLTTEQVAKRCGVTGICVTRARRVGSLQSCGRMVNKTTHGGSSALYRPQDVDAWRAWCAEQAGIPGVQSYCPDDDGRAYITWPEAIRVARVGGTTLSQAIGCGELRPARLRAKQYLFDRGEVIAWAEAWKEASKRKAKAKRRINMSTTEGMLQGLGYFTARVAASRLRVTRQRFSQLVQEGQLTPVKEPRLPFSYPNRLYFAKDVQELVEDRKTARGTANYRAESGGE